MLLFFYKNFLIYVMIFVFLLLGVAIATLLDRKVMGSIQRRKGPNVAGIFGILQPIADGLKLFLKEIVFPTQSNVVIFFLAPVFTFFCSLLLWFVVPFNEGVVLTDIPFSMLYILAISSLSVYGILFSGWSSNSKYSFLGSLRSVAQMISYEVSMGFLIIVVVLMGDSFNIVDIVKSQNFVWFLFPLFPLWILFLIVALAETNRAPFDLPEAEAELVAGYNVEYSSIGFALLFLGEYANIIFMSSMLSLLFMGGWIPIMNLNHLSINDFGFFLFGMKVSFHVFIFCWVRASFPRYRYDQLMKLSWKVLMPISVVAVLSVGLCLVYGYVFFK
uniref:NADH-ubiquinone oxidoreductase chain 1 n=1 Tax=Pleurostomum flabellatum TaxID=405751 RepID=A0A7T0M402_9EUKA|nr:NADH dehydrogenase subunit 1 [Pleurostomum flabellatum]QPL15601.1 NADH dehydrogenase subunit 1 [Pleurostomum flabellatum]